MCRLITLRSLRRNLAIAVTTTVSYDKVLLASEIDEVLRIDIEINHILFISCKWYVRCSEGVGSSECSGTQVLSVELDR